VAFCVNCGKEVKNGARFCDGCGSSLSGSISNPVSAGNHEKLDVGASSMEQIADKQKPQQTAVLQPRPTADEMYCFSCGAVIKKIAEICPKCGVKQNANSQNAPTEKKNNIVFFVFTIFFAVVGMVLYSIGFLFWLEDEEPYGFVFATIAISIGILFSIISLYRKPNKMYFGFCISPCILLVVWGVLFLLTMDS
jgi:RNA polymerase subunit RPABC4/transcription elongation factor Spt4